MEMGIQETFANLATLKKKVVKEHEVAALALVSDCLFCSHGCGCGCGCQQLVGKLHDSAHCFLHAPRPAWSRATILPGHVQSSPSTGRQMAKFVRAANLSCREMGWCCTLRSRRSLMWQLSGGRLPKTDCAQLLIVARTINAIAAN
jgi:hypothetical protein